MKHRLLILGVALTLAFSSAACTKLQARDNLNKGVRAFKLGNFEEAAKLFKTAIELDPSLDVAEVYLATAYYKQYEKDSDETAAKNAIETFEKVLEKNPTDGDAVAGIAGVYSKMNRYDKARDYYLKQTQLKADDATAFYAVASLDWKMASPQSGTYSVESEDAPSKERQTEWIDEGLQFVDKALAINPDYEDAQTFKNLLFREKARLAEDGSPEQAAFIKQADEWFEKAIETRKKNAEKNKALGIVVGGQ
ncbi:MAG TPA: tetratricopeptide repeat protein [Terriglobia bacterium]|nr:tetratricopeptide repeat protein [Terriglobia bacterium]